MKYYTTKEISYMLALSIKTIQKLVRDKQIVAYRMVDDI